MTPRDDQRFRQLPEPVRPEDLVESVDVTDPPPGETESQERDRMLREAGGA